MKTPRYGLRTTVLLFDTVVDQSVRWDNPDEWSEMGAPVPTEEDMELGEFRWCDDTVQIRTSPNTMTTLSSCDQVWSWKNLDGVEVDYYENGRLTKKNVPFSLR